MCTNNHAASRRLVFGAGLVALLMLLVMLLPAATARHDQDEALPDAAAGSSLLAHELHPADNTLSDEVPARDPGKPASKPCKRINQIAKSLLEKPQLVQIALLALISPPANQPVLAMFVAPEFPLDSSLVRRSGLTLAPPLFA